MNNDTNDPAALTGAYALNSLNEQERELVEQAMLHSETLRTEVAELVDTAVLLGLASTPVAPSAQLRSNIFAMLDSTPQLPALNAEAVPAPVLSAVPASGSSDAEANVSAASAPTAAERRAQSRWFSRPVMALVGAAAAIALFAGGAVVTSALNGTSQASQQAAAFAELNAAPDVQRADSELSNGGTATLIWSGSLAKSAIVFDDVKDLPSDKALQLWYIDDSGATSAGLYTPGVSGSYAMLAGTMHAGESVGVTVEPASGSKTPTTTPVVVIATA